MKSTFILIYVDDIIASREESIIEKVKNIFKNSFKIHVCEMFSWFVERSEDGDYSVLQSEYIERVLKGNSKSSSVPLYVSYGKSDKESSTMCNNKCYQKIIGTGVKIVTGPVFIKEDNQSCIKIVEGFKLNNRTKHIDIKYYFVKDYVNKGIIKCQYCPTNNMEADLLTKPLSLGRIKDLRTRLKIADNLE